jgi:hypothetical protein
MQDNKKLVNSTDLQKTLTHPYHNEARKNQDKDYNSIKQHNFGPLGTNTCMMTREA